MVDKLTGVYTRSGFKKGKTNDSSVVFAESIFAMTASMNQWVEFESQLSNFRKSKYDSKSVNFDEINEAEKEAINREVSNKRDELKEALESGRMLSNDNELKSYLDNYMNNFRINTENIDKVSEQYYDSEEEKIKTDEINFYKPSDFYPVFEIFGAMMVSNMPTRVAPFLYNDAGTRIPTTTFHSHLTKSMLSDENGKLALYRDVDKFIDNVLTTSKELIDVNDIKELKNYISEINRDAVNVKFRIEEDKGKITAI